MALNVQLTTPERDQIVAPPDGETVFDTTEDRLLCRVAGSVGTGAAPFTAQWVPVSQIRLSASTAGNAAVNILSIAIPEGHAASITFVVTGFEQTGGADNRGMYQGAGLFHFPVGGNNALQGETFQPAVESNANWSCGFFLGGGGEAEIRVQGDAGENVNWSAWVEYVLVSAAP